MSNEECSDAVSARKHFCGFVAPFDEFVFRFDHVVERIPALCTIRIPSL